MNVNVSLRSNVCVGTPSALRSDSRLKSQVRGRAGLTKLLQRLEPGQPHLESAAKHLTPEQIAQLLETPCSECGFFTVGPVRSEQGPVLAVRCPRGECAATVPPARALLMDAEMHECLGSVLRRTSDLDMSGAIASALSRCDQPGTRALVLARRTAVRLPPALYYRYYTYTDRQFSERVKYCLRYLSRHG